MFIFFPSIFCLSTVSLTTEAHSQIDLPSVIESNDTGEVITYVDRINGLQMTYFPNWTKVESNETVEFLAPFRGSYDTVQGGVRLQIVDSNNMTSDELLNSFKNYYGSVLNNFKLGAISDAQLSERQGKMLTFSSEGSDLERENTIAIFVPIRENKSAVLQYKANSNTYPLMLPIVERMINSFKILPTSTSSEVTPLSQVTSRSYDLFEDLSNGVRIQFPSDWSYNLVGKDIFGRGATQIVSFASPNPQNGTNPVITTLGIERLGFSDVSLDDYAKFRIDPIRKSNVTVIDEVVTNLSGMPAYKVFYDDEGINVMEIWTVYEGKAYAITIIGEAQVFDGYLPDVEHVINSFEVLPTTISSNVLPVSEGSEFKTYENKTNGIKIDYPQNWRTSETESTPSDESMCYLLIQCKMNIVKFTSPQEQFSDVFRESLTITDFFAKDSTLDDLVNLFTGDYTETLTDYKPILAKNITLFDNSTAQMTVYQYSDKEVGRVNAFDVFSINGKIAYWMKGFIEPDKYPTYFPIIEKMINSFEVLPTTISSNVLPVSEGSEFKTYENKTNGIKIDYPQNWAAREIELPPAMAKNAFGIRLISIPQSNVDSFQEKLSLLTINPLENITLEDWVSDQSQEHRQSQYNHDLTITSSMLGDMPALNISYVSTERDSPVQKSELYSKRYDRLYMISFESPLPEYSSQAELFNRVIETFEIPSQIFSNSTMGISVEYPFDWMPVEGSESDNTTVSVLDSSYNSSYYLISPDGAEIATILIENFPQPGISLGDYVNATIPIMGVSPSSIESTRTLLSGDNATKLTYLYSGDGIDMKGSQIISLNNQTVYTISYDAERSKYSENTEKMLIDTFTKDKDLVN